MCVDCDNSQFSLLSVVSKARSIEWTIADHCTKLCTRNPQPDGDMKIQYKSFANAACAPSGNNIQFRQMQKDIFHHINGIDLRKEEIYFVLLHSTFRHWVGKYSILIKLLGTMSGSRDRYREQNRNVYCIVIASSIESVKWGQYLILLLIKITVGFEPACEGTVNMADDAPRYQLFKRHVRRASESIDMWPSRGQYALGKILRAKCICRALKIKVTQYCVRCCCTGLKLGSSI